MRIRPLTAADVPFALSLSRQAGWNQLEADWQRALVLQPNGCFLAEHQGQPAGTTTTCILGDVAWIAMVLVEASLRGQGIGAALMQHALRFLEDQGITSIWLDATPMGEPVYRKLGFVEEGTILRHRGDRYHGVAISSEPRSLTGSDWPALLTLDRSVYGYDRERLLRRAHDECPRGGAIVAQGASVRGFVFLREGFNAIQLGPLVVDSGEVGAALVQEGLRRSQQIFPDKPVFIDVPEKNTAAIEAVAANGFSVQRRLLRMRRGTPRVVDERRIWASSGPEKG